MKTRKQPTPVKKRTRSRPIKRGAGGLPPEAPPYAPRASGGGPQGRREATRIHEDGSLILTAECTVAEADALKSELARRLPEPEPVTVDVSALQRIDTAGLQLLAAFVRDRRTAGHVVAWRGRACALEAAAGLLGLRAMLELPGEVG
jgi:ABC-type transporter Mla MlaB component